MRDQAPAEYEIAALEGQELAYLSLGSGPLVLLLHGYPDTARGWLPVMETLADAGYRAVAPALPGYPPSGASPTGDYDARTNAAVMLALAEHLGADRFFLCGLDWGYFIAFAMSHLDPGSVAKLAAGHAHPKNVGFTDPRVTWHARHALLHQVPRLATAVTRRDDFAYLDRLYRRWSPTWRIPDDATADVKATFSVPGALEEALAYYPAQLRTELLPSGRPARTLLRQRTRVATLLFRGPHDPMTVEKWFRESPALFPEGCTVVDVEGTGHFPHREDPEQFAAMLLDFYGSAEEAPR